MTEPTLRQLCRDAAKVLENNAWTRHVNARNGKGEHVVVSDEDACQFCMLGAFYRALHESGVEDYGPWLPLFYDAFIGAARKLITIPTFNDVICESKQQAIDTLLLMAERAT